MTDVLAEIAAFVAEMEGREQQLPTIDGGIHDGLRVDDDGCGEYAEFELAPGITLVLDWHYLDAKSTAVVTDFSLHPLEGALRTLDDVPGLDDLTADLVEPLGYDTVFEWSAHNDVWLA